MRIFCGLSNPLNPLNLPQSGFRYFPAQSGRMRKDRPFKTLIDPPYFASSALLQTFVVEKQKCPPDQSGRLFYQFFDKADLQRSRT